MITRIQPKEVYRNNNIQEAKTRKESRQAFKGIPPEIINVSIIDLATAILPRT